MATITKIDLQPFIDHLSNTGFKSLREADGYYLDCVNAIFDTYDFLLDLPRKISPDTALDTLAFIQMFEPQVARMLDVLDQTGFDCKNFDRLYHMLLDIEEGFPKIKRRLKKLIL